MKLTLLFKLSLLLAMSLIGGLGCEPPAGERASSVRGEAARLEADAGCPEARRRCTVRMSYRARGEASVEVRGDFSPAAWTKGTPMTKHGSTFVADVDVPYGRDVQYKFYLDGARWSLDPANGETAGGNSRLESVTCNPSRCEVP